MGGLDAYGGAAPRVGEGVDIIFIVRAPAKDEFTGAMTHYVKTVLAGQIYQEVDNLEDIFGYLSALGEQGTKVRRIRLVAHGAKSGGVAMTPRAGTKKWFAPKEVAAHAKKPEVRETVRKVMAPGAVMEFWGCNLGNVPKAGQAWADLFKSTFVAPKGTIKTEYFTFLRPALPGEKGESVNRPEMTPAQRKIKWVAAKSSGEIGALGEAIQADFETFLQDAYFILLRNGDIDPRERDYPEMLQFMRELFDRAEGDIRRIVAERGEQKAVGPGDAKQWPQLWVCFAPISIEAATRGEPQSVDSEPAAARSPDGGAELPSALLPPCPTPVRRAR